MKKNNFLIKDNLIQSLKQTNNNTEKKLLETLLHEDKLIKDNERLRKENETYKSLTIVFENELKKNKKCGSSSPLDKNYIKHIKTHSDYGFQSNSIINDIYGSSIAKCETINYEKKSPLSDKKIKSINSNRSKELYRTNKYRIINNNNKKMKKIVKNFKVAKNNNIKIDNSNRLLRNNTLRETIKISLNKASLNFKQKNKKIQDNKNEEMVTNKNRIKKDFSSSNKFAQNNNNNNTNTNTHNNKYRILMTHNVGNHNSCNKKKIIKKNKTIKTKKKKFKIKFE